MLKTLSVSVIQAAFSANAAENRAKVTTLIRRAAQEGGKIMLIPELFESEYFCRSFDEKYFALAKPAKQNPTIEHFQNLARELAVVIVVPFFEKDGPLYFNSVAIVDADGSSLGVYRKTHIPEGPGYQEKFYFSPGDTGYKVWQTRYGKIGVGICWDQWFPEVARSMVLMGADILLYPSAIGSEPTAPDFDTKDLWQGAMIGHTISNVIPLAAANRIGNEGGEQGITFYGASFIANHHGKKIKELGRNEEGVITATFDLQDIETNRAGSGLLRDRRPETYQQLSK